MAALSPYLCSTISILSIMLASLASIILVCPLLNKSFSKHIISMLTMLAVGCLCGDAIFHLIPHSLGLHYDVGTSFVNLTVANVPTTKVENRESIIVWKCSLIIASIYMFYLLNNLMKFFNLGHGHSHGHSHNMQHLDLPVGGEAMKNNMDNYVQAKFNNLKTDGDEGECESEYQQLLLNIDLASAQVNHKPEVTNKPNLRHIPRIVWMIMIVGVLHNLTDGLAVGASFAGGVSGGISTTLAVLFHEIPHEIGDFVILLKAGIKPKYAILFASATYIASLVGSFAGVALGKELDIVEWIFAVTAGMFLYIALVELLPDTIDATEEAVANRRVTFLWQNVGFLLGTFIMALIALYEDKIKLLTKSY